MIKKMPLPKTKRELESDEESDYVGIKAKKKVAGLIPAINRNMQHAREANALACRILELLVGPYPELKGQQAEKPDPSGLTAKVDTSTNVTEDTEHLLEQILKELE